MTSVTVQGISTDEARPWILGRHYARRMPCITHAYGAFVGGVLSGICTFGMPASPSLCVGVCGERYKDSVLELNRVCIADGANLLASQLVGRSLKLLGRSIATGYVVVSYADTKMGHTGKIYQATNWIYTGLTKARTDIGNGGSHSRHYDKNADYATHRQPRSPKHRYIYIVGNKRWVRDAKKSLKYTQLPYPKGESRRYDASEPIETQTIMEL